MTDFNLQLLKPVSTFKLLDHANISDDERKLALALGIDIENTKFTLKSLFFWTKNLQTERNINLKQEEAFFTKNKIKGANYLKLCQQNDKKLKTYK